MAYYYRACWLYVASVVLVVVNILIAQTSIARITSGVFAITLLIVLLPVITRAAKIQAIRDALDELRSRQQKDTDL